MNNLVFIYLNQSHQSSKILSDVNKKMNSNIDAMIELKSLTIEFYEQIKNGHLSGFIDILRESWKLKKQTSNMVSNTFIDELYDKAISLGAKAGKVLGAGGGGFFMFYVPLDIQEDFINYFENMKILKLNNLPHKFLVFDQM